MTWLIAAVMLVTIGGVVAQMRQSTEPRWRRVAIAALALVPIALAPSVVFPAARQLATTSVADERLHVARTIARTSAALHRSPRSSASRSGKPCSLPS